MPQPTDFRSKTSDPNRPADTQNPMPARRLLGAFLLILLLNFLLARLFLPEPGSPVNVPYTLFKAEAAKGNVEAIFSQGERIEGKFEQPVLWPKNPENTEESDLPEPQNVERFTTTLPAFLDPGLEALLIENEVEIRAEPIETRNPLITLLFGFGPALFLIGFYVWLFRRARRQGGMGSGMLGLGKSKARRYDQEKESHVTFDDVAGIEETAKLVDSEILSIIADSYQQALDLLTSHRKELDALAAALLERETLDENEILKVTGLPPAPALESARVSAAVDQPPKK